MQIYRRPTLFFEGGCIPKIQIAPKIFRDRRKTTVYLLLLHSPEAHNDDDQRHPGGAPRMPRCIVCSGWPLVGSFVQSGCRTWAPWVMTALSRWLLWKGEGLLGPNEWRDQRLAWFIANQLFWGWASLLFSSKAMTGGRMATLLAAEVCGQANTPAGC